MILKKAAKGVVALSLAGSGVSLAYAGVLWAQTALADGVQMMEAVNIGKGLLLVAMTVFLFVLAENPEGKTILDLFR